MGDFFFFANIITWEICEVIIASVLYIILLSFLELFYFFSGFSLGEFFHYCFRFGICMCSVIFRLQTYFI